MGVLKMKDYEIKIDGEKSQFDGGAIRYKKNKGRMDLIPEGPLQVIINHIENNCTCHKDCADPIKEMKKLKHKARDAWGKSEMKNAMHSSDNLENVKRESKVVF